MIADSTAMSMSASPKTMKGAFPPSSMLTFFMVPAASCVNNLPTLVDPVKLILLISGLFTISCAAWRSVLVTIWKRPGGIPASTASFPSAIALNGVSLGGLTITEQPAANAGATFLVIMAAGKFQGVMIPQTPTGSLKVMTVEL